MPYRHDMRRNAERGASFIIALVLLLVCTMVATVIVTSASVSVERSRKTTEEQQAYFAVSSAIRAARELYEGPINDIVLELPEGSSDYVIKQGIPGDSGLADWIRGAASAVYSGRGENITPYVVKVSLDSDAENSLGQKMSIPTVDLVFTMGYKTIDQYEITVTAQIPDNGEHTSYAQAISTVVGQKTVPVSNLLYWGSGPGGSSDENAPDPGVTVYGEPYMSDVWGTDAAHDSYWMNMWKKCKWKATDNSELFVAVNPSHYIVTIYYQGSYYIPVCVADGTSGYNGKAMAAKIPNETSLTAMPADGVYNCERRIIEADGSEPEKTTPNSLRDFSIVWRKVS